MVAVTVVFVIPFTATAVHASLLTPPEMLLSGIELTQQQGTAIFLITVFLMPLLLSIAGVVIWVIRKKL